MSFSLIVNVHGACRRWLVRSAQSRPEHSANLIQSNCNPSKYRTDDQCCMIVQCLASSATSLHLSIRWSSIALILAPENMYVQSFLTESRPFAARNLTLDVMMYGLNICHGMPSLRILENFRLFREPRTKAPVAQKVILGKCR